MLGFKRILKFFNEPIYIILMQHLYYAWEMRSCLFDGIIGVTITIGCVTDGRLRDNPPLGNRKHNTSVVFDC